MLMRMKSQFGSSVYSNGVKSEARVRQPKRDLRGRGRKALEIDTQKSVSARASVLSMANYSILSMPNPSLVEDVDDPNEEEKKEHIKQQKHSHSSYKLIKDPSAGMEMSCKFSDRLCVSGSNKGLKIDKMFLSKISGNSSDFEDFKDKSN